MAKGVVLFNGIRFPFSLIDASFDWAKERAGSLTALYMISNEAYEEEYIFPSDLDVAESFFTDADSVSADMNIVQSNLQMLKHRAETDGILLQSQLITNPSEEKLNEIVKEYDVIFMADQTNQGEVSQAIELDINHWAGKLHNKVRRIPSNNR